MLRAAKAKREEKKRGEKKRGGAKKCENWQRKISSGDSIL
jgi:hypothetical protein